MTALPDNQSSTEDGRVPPLVFEQRRNQLLDVAATLALIDGDGTQRVLSVIEDVAAAHLREIEAHSASRRMLISGEIAAISEEIVRRNDIKTALEQDYATRANLRRSQAETRAALAAAEAQLLSKRYEAEDKRMQQELDELRKERLESLAMLEESASAREEGEPIPPTPTVQEERLRALEQRREEMRTSDAPLFAREEALRARWITRTVAGFLLWLGYASAIATGTAFAIIMSPEDLNFGVLIDGWRALVSSLVPSGPLWLRVMASIGYLAGLLALIAAVVALFDWFLDRRKAWDEEKERPGAQLVPQGITRESYMQFLAAIPYALAAGMVLTILVAPQQPAGGAAAGTSLLSSILPTVGYTFVGVAIAFLATAIFVMYVIRIVEPRSDEDPGKRRVIRRSWEFVVPPLLLITAIALTPRMLQIELSVWLPWVAFMLMSSLALACGLVYHGIFKDAQKARERLFKLEGKIDRFRRRGDQMDGDAAAEVDRSFVKELRSLLDLRRRTRLGRRGLAAPAPPSIVVQTERGLKALLRRLSGNEPTAPAPAFPVVPAPVMQGLILEYRPIDFEVAAELVGDIEKEKATCAAIDAEITDLDRAIERNEALISYESMIALVRRREGLCALRDATPHEHEEQKVRTEILKNLLILDVVTTAKSARVTKPWFDEVSAEMTGSAS